MTKKLTILLLLALSISCNFSTDTILKISSQTAISVDNVALTAKQKGEYTFEFSRAYPCILTVSDTKNEWEVYVEPQKQVEIMVDGDSLIFKGDLIAENQHLQSEAKENEAIVTYLSQNWYSLHKSNLNNFIHQLDSLQSILLKNLDSNKEINSNFKSLDRSSIAFAFDRMILRYPKFHQIYTGNNVSLPAETLNAFKARVNKTEHLHLSSYKRFTKTLLDIESDELLARNRDYSTYRGLLRTNASLQVISKRFSNKELQDYWCFEYVKEHIKKYTWINGKNLLNKLKKQCKTKSVCKEINRYENEILEKRDKLETIVYKTENDFKLEAYIYRPQNFDVKKKYAALAVFHGGGWIIGDANFTINEAKHAAKNGLIGFSVEYRLSNYDDITPEEATQDVRDFIKWIRNHADSLSIHPNQIIAKGLSAGGHLVASASVIQKDKNSVPNAIILVSPALDTKDVYFKSLLRKEQNEHSLSPLENLKEGLSVPNTLILQGRTDNLTPTKYVEEFKWKMDSCKYQCELVIYENCGHLFTPSHLDDTAYPQSDPEISKKAYAKQAEFYKELGYSQGLSLSE